VFTPDKYTMEISAKVYESWKFTEQGLPFDLVARCSFASCGGSVNHQTAFDV
jgi:hypothetical protein